MKILMTNRTHGRIPDQSVKWTVRDWCRDISRGPLVDVSQSLTILDQPLWYFEASADVFGPSADVFIENSTYCANQGVHGSLIGALFGLWESSSKQFHNNLNRI